MDTVLDFSKVLETIKEWEDKMLGLTFEQAYKACIGYNYDGERFDYDLDDHLIGTIDNRNGMAFMDNEHLYYEYWDGGDMVFCMTKAEIEEQVKRTKE